MSTYHIILILNAASKVLLVRFPIGHSKLSYTYLLKGEQQPECISCNCPLTLYHIFLECIDTFPARNLLLDYIQSMQDLFTKVNINDILLFLQESDFYYKVSRFLHFYIFYIHLIFLCPLAR